MTPKLDTRQIRVRTFFETKEGEVGIFYALHFCTFVKVTDFLILLFLDLNPYNTNNPCYSHIYDDHIVTCLFKKHTKT